MSCESSFFELGGVSLQVINMLDRIQRRYGIQIGFTEFMKDPTIRFIADKVDGSENKGCEESGFVPVSTDNEERFGLTDLQQSYYLGRKEGFMLSDVVTHSCAELKVDSFDEDKIISIINKMTEKHSMLRCRFDDAEHQHFRKSIDAPVFIEKLSTENDNEAYISERFNEINQLVLDPEKDVMFRAYAFVSADGSAYIVFYFDNMILDGRSTASFINEFSSEWAGVPAEEGGFIYSFADHIENIKRVRSSEKYAKDREFWLERIASLPEPVKLPLDNQPELIEKAVPVCYNYGISDELWNKVGIKARKNGLSEFSVILTALIRALGRVNYGSRFLLSIPEYIRPSAPKDFDRMLGEFSDFMIFDCENVQEDLLTSAKKNQEQLWELKEHNSFGGTEILREICRASGDLFSGVIPVVFTSMLEADIASYSGVRLLRTQSHTSQVQLEIVLSRYNGRINLCFTTLEGLVSESTAASVYGIVSNILADIAESGNMLSDMYDVLPETDKRIIGTAALENKELEYSTVREMLLESFEKHGSNTALVYRGKEYTYDELRSLADKAAAFINEKADGEIAAVLMDNSVERIAAIIGVVLSGKVYMPLEYEYPAERVKLCLDNAGVRTLITDAARASEFSSYNTYTWNDIESGGTAYDGKYSSNELFTVIHTSGSTGVPKAVMVKNAGVVNCIAYTNERFGVNKNDRAIALTNVSHDLSLYDIFGMLTAGGCIVIPDADKRRDPIHWKDIAERFGVTVWNSVPAFMEMFTRTLIDCGSRLPNSLRLVFLGGDFISPSNIQNIFDLSDGIRTVSVGGPTETTMWNICHEITSEDLQKGYIPYGRQIANCKYRILNEAHQEMCAGVAGLMFCEGISLSEGYLNAPEETAKRFVLSHSGERMYDTGDLGCWLENGEIRIFGRADNQVKILGKRIEIPEIEKSLTGLGGIEEVVVCADTAANRIYAFYKAESEVDEDNVRALAGEILPSYMIPNSFCRVNSFPLSYNGKVSRKELISRISAENTVTNADHSRMSLWEKRVYDVIQEMVPIPGVKAEDNLFMAGVNSLTSVMLVNRLHSLYGISIPVSEFFNEPTIAATAKKLSCSRSEVIDFEIDKSKKWDNFPLSELQQAYVVGRDPDTELGSVPTHFYAELLFDNYYHERLYRTFYTIVNRHDVFRCIIRQNGTQQFVDEELIPDIPLRDLSYLNEAEREKIIHRIRYEMAHSVLDPEEYPLFRLCVSKISKTSAIVHMYFDTLIADGWSANVLADEIDRLYSDPDAELKPLGVDFRDYVLYKQALEKTEKFSADRQYWIDRIDDFPEAASLPLLCDPKSIKHVTCDQKEAKLTKPEWTALEEKAKKYGTSLFSVNFILQCYNTLEPRAEAAYMYADIRQTDVPSGYQEYGR